MPEAKIFRSKGRGNGFPFCPNRIDIDEYAYWITLGGYKKGDTEPVTDEQKALSWVNAMKIWWNLYKVTGSASLTDSNGATESVTDSLEYLVEPYERSCPFGLDAEDLNLTNSNDFSAIHAILFRTRFIAMVLNGEFIGYGFGYNRFSQIKSNSAMAYASGADLAVSGGSVLAIYSAMKKPLSTTDFTSASHAYTEISGIPVWAVAAGQNFPDSGNGVSAVAILNPDDLSASSTYTAINGPTTTTTSTSSSLTGFEYYEYP